MCPPKLNMNSPQSGDFKELELLKIHQGQNGCYLKVFRHIFKHDIRF